MSSEIDHAPKDVEPIAAGEGMPDLGDPTPSPSAPKESPWNSLERSKLAVAVLIPISILAATQLFASRQRDAEDQKARKEAIQKLSRSILERRSRAELVYSAMVRQNLEGETKDSREELIRRKKDYDEAFASWNTTISDNMIVLRQATDQSTYSNFESYFQKSLSVQVFKKMDTCLTKAYDKILRGEPKEASKEATKLLDECLMPSLLGQALACGYALTEQARAIVNDPSKQDAAHNELEKKCPKPTDGEPQE